MSELSRAFERMFFFNEVNRFVGSGGEVLVKSPKKKRGSSSTRIEIGDRLVGIGVTHLIESLSRPPGPASFRATSEQEKMAARAFEVTAKKKVGKEYRFGFSPLSPENFSSLIEQVSGGSSRIEPTSIPKGTMVLSFLDANRQYSLQTHSGSPGTNWRQVTSAERHWCVGIGKSSDFWESRFPSDDIGILSHLPPWPRIGTINFGLSLLNGSEAMLRLEPVPFQRDTGETTTHDFCMFGSAVGTQGLETPFPIGLRTEIVFKPLGNPA
jgi:hypothetical protein